MKSKSSKSSATDIHSIICNSNEANSTSFIYFGKLLDKTGKYGQICSNLIAMQDAQEKGHNNIVILADDVSINLHEAWRLNDKGKVNWILQYQQAIKK